MSHDHPCCIVTLFSTSFTLSMIFFSTGCSTTGTWDYFLVTASMFSCLGIVQYTFSSSVVMPFPWTLNSCLCHPSVSYCCASACPHTSAVQHSQTHGFAPWTRTQLGTTFYVPHDSSVLHTRVQTPHQKSHAQGSHRPFRIFHPASFSAAVGFFRTGTVWLRARGWSCFLLSFLPSFLRRAGCDSLNAVVYCFCFHI